MNDLMSINLTKWMKCKSPRKSQLPKLTQGTESKNSLT